VINRSFVFSFATLVARPSAVVCAALFLSAAQSARAESPVSAGFAQLAQGGLETRSFSFKDLGIPQDTALGAPSAARDFFLPVPAGLPIQDAAVQLNGAYVRGDGGRTTMLMTLDGSPVLARAFTESQGAIDANLGVAGVARDSGFVRMGVEYASVINDNVCADQTAIGNAMRVSPATTFSYKFNPADIHDLRTAWSALPQAPVLGLGSDKLSAAAFDTAWRADALLQRDGKKPVAQALPAVGDSVDLTGVAAPEGLRSIPAFNALLSGGKHAIASKEELGALIALSPRSAFGPDVFVADAQTRAAVNAALDALRAQIASSAPDGAEAFDNWRHNSADGLSAPLAAGEARLAHVGGRAVIVVGDNAALSVLSAGWRPIGVSDRLVVHQIDPTARAHGDKIPFSELGGEPRSIDVQIAASWDANFDMAAASSDGMQPDEVVLDLAAAPTLSNGGATATVYFNDVMIGAQMLQPDGLPHRLALQIPRFALARTNDLRVTFRRQPDAHCQARQSYPVAVLPTSHLKLAKRRAESDFVGMAARYAGSATVLAPQSYLDSAVLSVPRLATIANATGVAPLSAKFTAIGNGDMARPDGAFLAADVSLADQKTRAAISSDNLTLTSIKGDKLIDVSGFKRVAVLSMATSGSQDGIVFRSTGAPLSFTQPPQIQRGDIAVLDARGVLKLFDTIHPDEVIVAGEGSDLWVTRHWAIWGIPALIVLLFVLIVAGARHKRDRVKARQEQNK